MLKRRFFRLSGFGASGIQTITVLASATDLPGKFVGSCGCRGTLDFDIRSNPKQRRHKTCALSNVEWQSEI